MADADVVATGLAAPDSWADDYLCAASFKVVSVVKLVRASGTLCLYFVADSDNAGD